MLVYLKGVFNVVDPVEAVVADSGSKGSAAVPPVASEKSPQQQNLLQPAEQLP